MPCDLQPGDYIHMKKHHLKQQSPTFLAPGTGFVEDNFSTDGVGRGRGMVHAVMRAVGSNGEQQMKLHSPASHSPAVRPGS